LAINYSNDKTVLQKEFRIGWQQSRPMRSSDAWKENTPSRQVL
jgi:hypothetical protein